MTLDEAIEHAKERAIFRDMCGQEHSELANWLEELKELRDKCCNLEKEVDWLAMELEKRVHGCEWCGEVVCSRNYSSCGYQGPDNWRKAARKVVAEQKD